jgi:hypothetical protein
VYGFIQYFAFLDQIGKFIGAHFLTVVYILSPVIPDFARLFICNGCIQSFLFQHFLRQFHKICVLPVSVEDIEALSYGVDMDPLVIYLLEIRDYLLLPGADESICSAVRRSRFKNISGSVVGNSYLPGLRPP